MSKRRPKLPVRRPLQTDRLEAKADGQWHFRPLTGASSTKHYRCPGCDHLIAPATPHVVAWPVVKSLLSESAIDERRHWHSPCWRRKA